MLRSKETTSLFLQTTLTVMIILIFTFAGSNPSLAANFAFAQNIGSNAIQILSTSSFVDDLGNFHVIGEVNNTSFDPQTNILVTTILSDTTNNIVVGNHSAFSSIGTLRSGELSPFDILVPDPQILGKFNFIEFSTSSQPAIEKPANLVLNGSSAFFDNVGNPHITGNIINQGQFPEQFINLVATFYDNSSLGIVGTQSFGINVANLSQNQMAPFDITITDNKTKSQAAFYSLNMDSTQSSMSLPVSLKSSFVLTGGTFNGVDVLSNNASSNTSVSPGIGNSNKDSNNPSNNSDNDDQKNSNNNDNQRGEKKTDENGNPYYNDENCSEEPGSSGGNSSECQDAENEEQSEREDEDSSESDQGPPSNSDSTGDSSEDDIDASNESDDDENTDSNEENDRSDDNDDT